MALLFCDRVFLEVFEFKLTKALQRAFRPATTPNVNKPQIFPPEVFDLPCTPYRIRTYKDTVSKTVSCANLH